MAVENVDQKYEVTVRFRLIRNCMLLSGISVFAQLYLFQPILSDLCRFFSITPATSSLTVLYNDGWYSCRIVVLGI